MDNEIEQIKSLLQTNINNDVLIHILFDINKYFDQVLTKVFRQEQKKENKIFNSIERKLLRNYYYYGNLDETILNIAKDFPTIKYSDEDICKVLSASLDRIKKYEKEKILNSIEQKNLNLNKYNKSSISHRKEWLEYYDKKREQIFDYSMFILRITNSDFQEHNSNEQYIYDIIKNTYIKLENYRYLALVFDNSIKDKNGDDITWKLIYKICIYAENFVQYDKDYFACKKKKRIDELNSFIQEKFNVSDINIASDFYKNISTGYKFEDCLISDNQEKIILTLKKIQLDETPIPCPSCMTTIQSGNSYPEMFLRSFECKNSHCQDRSKSGRGKRFDEYGTYRNFKLEENNNENVISNDLYSLWRRDIFNNDNDEIEMLIKFYTWNNEKILIYNLDIPEQLYSRNIIKYKNQFENLEHTEYINNYNSLPIYKLFSSLHKLIKKVAGVEGLNKKIEIFNLDSSIGINNLKVEQIGAVITSPPYYNAREYSQWGNLLLYLIDMMINCSAIYHSICKNSYYLYNIGDIVNQDNVYVNSHMSNRRLPLGFLSCMIFEIAGFNLVENIIWDKGEVQSKRNSTINLFAGYVKCINCYEHVLVFKKGEIGINHKKIVQISPVIKINSKGENKYKHTAPYPIELVSLIKYYARKDKYILDPYLGSGTTLIWCKKNNYKGVGYELNNEYFELAKNNLNNIDKKKDD